MRNWLIGAHVHRFRPDELALFATDILRDINQYRAGASGCRDVECLTDNQGNILNTLYQKVVLGCRTGNADNICFLKSIVANQSGWHLAGEADRRNGVCQ